MNKIILSIKRFILRNFGGKTTLPTIMESGAKYRIIYPCNDTAIRAANLLAYEAFGKRNHVTEETVKTWLNKNPNLLSVMVDSKFEVRGYYDILPITQEAFDDLYNGVRDESQISAEDILAPDQPYDNIYIGGITSSDGNPFVGTLLLSGLLLKLKYIYRKANYNIGAIAATPEGRHYLELFGFEQSIHPRASNFYSRRIEPGDVAILLEEVGRRTTYLDSTAYRWNAVIESNATLTKLQIG